MSQNTSSAVMQQRSEPHNSLDDFPTPPWATRALCNFLANEGYDIGMMRCREPAANRGHMVKPLAEFFNVVEASDIFDYGAGFRQSDYLFGPIPEMLEWTITNPPFRLAEQFIERMAASSRIGFAVIVRAAFLEGQGRYERLFSKNPPSFVLQFTERVGMFRSRLVQVGTDDHSNLNADGKPRKAATATAYAWLVWIDGESPTQLRWIAPCRKQLERAEDYI